MRIRGAQISKFKGTHEPQEVALRPLTFIGGNSSGYSRCIHGLAALGRAGRLPIDTRARTLDDGYTCVHQRRFREAMHTKTYRDAITLGLRMGRALLCAVTMGAGLLGGARAFPEDAKVLPMPCLQVASRESVTRATGRELVLVSAAQGKPGESSCGWESASDGSGKLTLSLTDRRGFPPSSPTAQAAYDAKLQAFSRAGLVPEPVSGVGEAAALFMAGDSPIVLVWRPDAVFSVTTIKLPRESALALARLAAKAPSPMLGSHATFPAPVPVTKAVPLELTAEEKGLPCVTLLTTPEVRTAGRAEVLAEVRHPRSGYSMCYWRETSVEESGFRLSVATAQEFADNRMAGPAEYFAAERGLALGDPRPLPGYGQEAFTTSSSRPFVVVRRATDVLSLSCVHCTLDELLVLARLAIR